MKRRFIGSTITMLVLAAVQPAPGDTVEMRDGSLMNGKYAGGTSTTVRVETAEGVKVIATTELLAITFGVLPPPPAAPPPAAAPAAAAVAAPAATPTAVSVPAGTVLTIKMDSAVSSKDPGGKKFTAKLLADLKADDVVVAKAGTTITGQVEQSKQAGRLAGKSQLALSLTGIDLGNGKVQPIVTTSFTEAGKGEFRKTARNVAGGALIGHAFDDDGGAGKGAAVGAGVSLIKKGDAVTVPEGALLEFRLSQPFQATVP